MGVGRGVVRATALLLSVGVRPLRELLRHSLISLLHILRVTFIVKTKICAQIYSEFLEFANFFSNFAQKNIHSGITNPGGIIMNLCQDNDILLGYHFYLRYGNLPFCRKNVIYGLRMVYQELCVKSENP